MAEPYKNVNEKNVFVVGLDEANLPTLNAVPGAKSLRLHPLMSAEELQGGEVSVPELLDKAQRTLDAFDGSIDAIVGYWDFPVSTLVPIPQQALRNPQYQPGVGGQVRAQVLEPARAAEGH
ncbi:hypothetical protein SALBM311S_10043 [Streptomyces alboniger]